jgi:RNA recognition motif-containing protein
MNTYTVYLGGLPEWVSADDIRAWLVADDLCADRVTIVCDLPTQISKGFAFLDVANEEERQRIIQRFNRAPLDGHTLRCAVKRPKV